MLRVVGGLGLVLWCFLLGLSVVGWGILLVLALSGRFFWVTVVGIIRVLLFSGLVLGGLGLFLSSSRYLGCLVVLESLKILVLGCCLLGDLRGFRVGFVSLLVMFTLEAVLGLVVLVRV